MKKVNVFLGFVLGDKQPGSLLLLAFLASSESNTASNTQMRENKQMTRYNLEVSLRESPSYQNSFKHCPHPRVPWVEPRFRRIIQLVTFSVDITPADILGRLQLVFLIHSSAFRFLQLYHRSISFLCDVYNYQTRTLRWLSSLLVNHPFHIYTISNKSRKNEKILFFCSVAL